MTFTKTLALAAFAYSASICFALPNSDGELVKVINLVQKLSKEMQCEVGGKSYSVGAIVVVDKAAFQCIQIFPGPLDINVSSTAWVQMLLPDKSSLPVGSAAKK